MKAVILAGGSGTRLAPISSDIPKPLAPLPGAPVMEYLVGLLRSHGITDIRVAVCHMSAQIEEYFGDGREFSVSMTYSRESEPMGTAGAARLCVSGNENESILVISADAVCDFDLTACLEFHKSRQSAATVLLSSCSTPTEYGLVRCAQDGRVTKLLEKPDWPNVFGTTVNTGIYILEPRVFDLIPSGQRCDFAGELFPAMLGGGMAVYGLSPVGYWSDIGSCEDYLRTCIDIMSGKVRLPIPESADVPEGVTVKGPCLIGEGCSIGEGSVIGPYACISPGSSIGRRSTVERSMVVSSRVGDGSSVRGAVLCSGSRVGRDCTVRSGAVLGGGSVLGAGSVVSENVRVWPGSRVTEGCVLRSSVTSSGPRKSVSFSEGGIISGEAGCEADAEFALHLGAVCRTQGVLGLGCDGSPFALSLMRAAAAGASGAGQELAVTDAADAAQASWAARIYGLGLSIFFEIDGGRMIARFYGKGSSPPERSLERRIEGALRRGEWSSSSFPRAGSVTSVTGVPLSHLEAALEAARGSAGCVAGAGAGRERLEALFDRMGKSSGGEPVRFELTASGRRLRALLPSGAELPEEKLLVLTGALLLERGVKELPLPHDAPMALRSLAERAGAAACNLRSPLYASGPPALRAMDDGLVAAAVIASALSDRSMGELSALIPEFHSSACEVRVSSGRARVMERFSSRLAGRDGPGGGLLCRDRRGVVSVSPCAAVDALRICAESSSAELARELCSDFEALTRSLDGQ